MKYIKSSCLLTCVVVCGMYGSESVQNIKKEYGLIFDKLFVQARIILQEKKYMIRWIKKQEFK